MGQIFFLFKVEEYSIICVYHILLIHSSVSGHLACSYLFTIANDASINMAAHTLFKLLLSFLLGLYTEVELQNHMEILCYIFWENTIPFSTVAIHHFICSQKMPNSSSFSISSQTLVFSFLPFLSISSLSLSLLKTQFYELSLVSVSQGCHNKWPQIWWLKTIEIYSLTVLEARRLKIGCFFWRVWGRICFVHLLFLVAAIGPWLAAASLQLLPLSSGLPPLCAFSPLIRTTPLDVGPS